MRCKITLVSLRMSYCLLTGFLLLVFLSIGRSTGEDHVEEGSDVMTNCAHDARQAQHGYEGLRSSSKKVLERIQNMGN